MCGWLRCAGWCLCTTILDPCARADVFSILDALGQWMRWRGLMGLKLCHKHVSHPPVITTFIGCGFLPFSKMDGLLFQPHEMPQVSTIGWHTATWNATQICRLVHISPPPKGPWVLEAPPRPRLVFLPPMSARRGCEIPRSVIMWLGCCLIACAVVAVQIGHSEEFTWCPGCRRAGDVAVRRASTHGVLVLGC